MMTQSIKHPFRLSNAFFVRVRFDRIPKPPDSLEISLRIQVKIVDERLPEILEVHLKADTLGEQPLTMEIVIVGLFNLVEGVPEPESSVIQDFVADRALPILWTYLDQMVTQVTAQMGMSPVRLNFPAEFDPGLAVEAPDSVSESLQEHERAD